MALTYPTEEQISSLLGIPLSMKPQDFVKPDYEEFTPTSQKDTSFAFFEIPENFNRAMLKMTGQAELY